MKHVHLKVSFLLPPEATIYDAKRYTADAVASMKGALHPPGAEGDDDPGDPMFELDGASVKVHNIKVTQARRYKGRTS